MAMWNPPSDDDPRDAEQRRIEDRAAYDAAQAFERIWHNNIPNGELEPVAAQFTRVYVEDLCQQSIGVPRWAFSSREAQRAIIEITGDRYYYAFRDALSKLMSQRLLAKFCVPPRTTPLLMRHQPSAAATMPERDRRRRSS